MCLFFCLSVSVSIFVYLRMSTVVRVWWPFQIERLMKEKGKEFMWSPRLGYICTCPSNLGTVLRCSVHVQLPLLSKVLLFAFINTKLSSELLI